MTMAVGPLRVDYVVTVDDFDDTPVLPGFVTDEIFWALVARLSGGRTRWRRIYLQPNPALPTGVADEPYHTRRHNRKVLNMKRGFPARANDLKGKARVVEIDHAPFETLKSTNGEEQQKIILYFVGVKKAMPLNMTNFDALADICGDDTDFWPGQKIELYPTTTQMGGKTVDCVRIRKPRELQPPPLPKRDEPEMDDRVPF